MAYTRREIRTRSGNRDLVHERREHIVQRAIRAFLSKGFHATNMLEVAESCSMSPGSLYRYVGSKEDILCLIVQHVVTVNEQVMESMRSKTHGVALTDSLRKCIGVYLQAIDDAQDVWLFVDSEMRSIPEPDRRELLARYVRNVAFFETLLKKGAELGEFEMEDPAFLAQNIILLCHAWATRRWFLRRQYALEEYTRKCTESTLKLIQV